MELLIKLKHWYLDKKSLPYWCIFAFDSLAIFLSGYVTYWLFFRGYETLIHAYKLLPVMLIYVALSWVPMKALHTYAGVVRYSSFVDLEHIFIANTVAFLLAVVAHWAIFYLPKEQFEHLGIRHLLVIYLLATTAMCTARVVVKTVYEVLVSSSQARRCLVYGTMEGGVAVAKGIRIQNPARFKLKGFITTGQQRADQMMMGVPVYGENDPQLADIIAQRHIEAVLVSPLRVSEFRNNEQLQQTLLNADVTMYMTGDTRQIDPDAPLSLQMREVQVEDLLPRADIKVDMQSIGRELTGHSVLITGAAGSIGQEIARQALRYQPSRLLLVDQAETPCHDLRLMLSRYLRQLTGSDEARDEALRRVAIVVTSICRADHMERLFSQHRPDYVFHAAAYKHVPMMEDNPCEAVVNNVEGTKIIADLAVKYRVRKFVMVSTDKAVNPTNVMGCSKRICEIYVQSLNSAQQVTQFVTTRFGNVLGSNGSVIPLFREQIKHGGPVTVTSKNVTRFFMLISEACELVLEAGVKGHGGEIFVFDMGQPVNIDQLARKMIHLSGMTGKVEVQHIGLRPGEKEFEEVLNSEENTLPSFHDKIRIAKVRQYSYEEANTQIADLIATAHSYDDMATVAKMKLIVPEYKSRNSVYEQLDS